MVSGCVDSFLLEIFPACSKGQCVYELFYKFEIFDASILHVTNVLCSFHEIKPLAQGLEVPSYSSEKLTLPEDDFNIPQCYKHFYNLLLD